MFVPRIRFVEFTERRSRRAVAGAVLSEHTDVPISEPLSAQTEKWLSRSHVFLLSSTLRHAHSDPTPDERFISITALLSYVDAYDMMQLTYG